MPDRHEPFADGTGWNYFWRCPRCAHEERWPDSSPPEAWSGPQKHEPGSFPPAPIKNPDEWTRGDNLDDRQKEIVRRSWAFLDAIDRPGYVHDVNRIWNLERALEEQDIVRVEKSASGLAETYASPYDIARDCPYHVWRPLVETIDAALVGKDLNVAARTAELQAEHEAKRGLRPELAVGDAVRVLTGEMLGREGRVMSVHGEGDGAAVELAGPNIQMFSLTQLHLLDGEEQPVLQTAPGVAEKLRKFEDLALKMGRQAVGRAAGMEVGRRVEVSVDDHVDLRGTIEMVGAIGIAAAVLVDSPAVWVFQANELEKQS